MMAIVGEFVAKAVVLVLALGVCVAVCYASHKVRSEGVVP